MGALGAALAVTSAAAQASSAKVPDACESGLLDPGESGMNVLVYELCPQRLTIGFRNSDVIEEISCGPGGEIGLWQVTDDTRCEGMPAAARDRVIELHELLRGVGRASAAPVRKLLTCRVDGMNRATVVVPDAREALLETRPGDTIYERVTRELIAHCLRPNA